MQTSFVLKQLPSCLSIPWPRHVLNPPQFLTHKFHFVSTLQQQQLVWNSCTSNGTTKPKTSTKKGRSRSNSSRSKRVDAKPNSKKSSSSTAISSSTIRTGGGSSNITSKIVVRQEEEEEKKVNVRALNQNGDPLGRKDLGKSVVKWICQAMRAMAVDFTSAESEGEFSELRQRTGPGLTFVIQAQPYLNAVPMPLGLEAICLKACTHYATLFEHFQRELRDVLQELQRKGLVRDWDQTESWKLLKELANSGIYLYQYLSVSLSF